MFGPGVRLPCLIALMRDPLTDAPVGIQRIALRAERDGQVEKIERRMLGGAGVVKLWPAGETLVVGEGLETVLAAATRIPYRRLPLVPAWAALSTAGLKALPIVPGVKRLDRAQRQRPESGRPDGRGSRGDALASRRARDGDAHAPDPGQRFQ